ncbi:uncharacterized protein [Apostichopus japonicus]|uniref:uncharacterized protein n=1 Tax=Stichopus japonicus TaxID=307972 RepID=UPI003AB273AA
MLEANIKSLLILMWILLVCFVIASEECGRRRRRSPPPDTTGPTADRCPSSQRSIIADWRQTSKRVFWENPQVSDPSGISSLVITRGQASGSEFTCDGSSTYVTYDATDTRGNRRTNICCFYIRCKTTTCGAITAIANGNVACSHDNIYGSICSFECSNGYELSGATSIVCDREGDSSINGFWSANPPSCRPVLCPMLEELVNGRIECTNRNEYQSRCYYICDNDYKIAGGNSGIRVCLWQDFWSVEAPACVDALPPEITCPEPLIIISDGTGMARYVTWADATAVDNTEGAVTVEQFEGPTLGTDLTVGFYTIMYKASDSFSNEATCSFLLTVKLIRCPPIYGTDAQTVRCTNEFNLDSECRFTCAIGYFLTNSNTVRCQNDESVAIWDTERPSCEVITCPSLPVPVNGRFRDQISECPVSYGSWCFFECNDGYNLIGSRARRCLVQPGEMTGFWDGDETLCMTVTCPNPFVAAAAFITNEEECQKTAQVPAGTICMYDCIEGYLVVGSPAIECTDRGFWNESAPRCDILRCSGANLPAPENGYKSGCPHSEEAYGTECILGCDVGFSPMESTRVTCLGDSNGTVYWSDTTPTCENITCPPIDPPDNGNYTICSLRDQPVTSPDQPQNYQTICTTTCTNGFTASGSHSRVCQINGQWDGVPLVCVDEDPPIIVVPPDPVKFAGPLELNVVVDYSEWEDDIIESAIDASPPVVLHLSSINGVAVTGGRTTVFQEGNHVLGYTSTDQAGNENRFSLQLTVKVIRCQALPLPHEGVADPVVGSDDCNVGAVLGSTCKISCDDGFHLSSDEAYFTCMARSAFNTLGEWVGESSQIECFPNQCNLTTVINGYISGCSGVTVDFDTTCQFICQEGYKDEDGRKRQARRCLEDGSWTEKELQCQVTQCPGPLDLADGVVIPSEVCENDVFIPFNTRCSFLCVSGFVKEGPSSSVCLDDGSWSTRNASTNCEDIQAPYFTSDCPQYIEEIAEEDQRSKVINYLPPSATDNSGNVTVTRFRGPEPNTLFSEGHHVSTYRAVDLSGNAAQCDVNIILTVKRCTVPQAPISGSLVQCDWIYGATCEYQCNSGYELFGSSQRRCEIDDNLLPYWDVPSPTCEAVKCPALNTNDNVIKSGCVDDVEEGFGTVCSLYCPFGFSSNGSSISRCQSDGTWDVNDFTCQESRCPRLQVPDDATVIPPSCQDDPSFGDWCVFSCPQGFQIFPLNLESVFCRADGSWTSDVSGASCKDYQPPHFTNCPKDHTIYLEIAASNTYVNWNLNVTDNSGVTTNSNCDIDHQRLPIGFYLVTCSASDEAGNYAYCSFAVTVKAYRCPVLLPPPLAQIIGPCVNFYGVTCTIECLSGFTIEGSEIATCQRNELTGEMYWEYSEAAPYCRVITCPPITDAHIGTEFGSVYPSICQQPDVIPPGSTCTLYCTHQFTLQSAITVLTCLPDETWDHDLDNLNMQCIDDISPVIVSCPPDFHVVLTQESPLAVVTFIEPTATDNSNEPLRKETSPPNLQSPYTSRTDTVLSCTFYDGANNHVTCTFRIIVEDNIYPVLEYCPDDIDIVTSTSKTVVEWLQPNFTVPSNDDLETHCNFQSGDEFSFGTYHVQCVATNPTNSKSTTCNFDVSLEPVTCVDLRPPDNGGLACDLWLYSTLCIQFCLEGWDIPRTMERGYDGEFLCGLSGMWIPPKVYDCSETARPGRMRLPNELHYVSGNCESSETQQQIAINFLELIEMDVPLFDTFCRTNQNCTVSNVEVICGNVTEGSRRIRSAAPISKYREWKRNSTGFKQRQLRILSREQNTVFKRHRRSLEQFEIKIKFDLLLDILEVESDEEFNEEVYTAEDSLYGLSDEIAYRAESGELSPEVDGLDLTIHDVVYYYISAVCETGFASDPLYLTCGACPRGTFDNEEEDICTPCPIGTYQNETEQTSCTFCPEGMSTLHEGSINITECLDFCEVGTNSPTGLTPCLDCDVASYQPEIGALECLPCPEGTMCRANRSHSVQQCISQCPPGMYSATGLIPCLPCTIHTYQPSRGETFCRACPDGYISPEEGANRRQDCSVLTGQALCDMSPCINGGTCVPGLDNFDCSCKEHYAGRVCEIHNGECALDCLNNGTCLESISGFFCQCSELFTGHDCSIPVDNCISDPCANNGTCISQDGGYFCYCTRLYRGVHCEERIDHCEPDPCAHGRCINHAKDQCICDAGYTGEFCDMEINECSSEPCFNEGFCVDLENDFACSCLNGFMGDLCEIDVDLCQNQPCPEYATCVDLDTRYVCVCPAGKTGSHCEEEVTPCKSQPCQNGGTCLNEGMLGEVRSMEFSYRCECVAGYTGVNCQLDVNECDSQPCSNNGTCYDLSNSYTCQCPPGFKGSQCESVEDPCVSSPCFNGGTCVVTEVIGQFKCQCTRDYDGSRCQDIIQWCINSTCVNGGSCSDDQVISTCDCPNGFRGTYCETKVNPCSPNPCLNNGECTEIGDGTFICSCMSGYDGSHCENRLPFCHSSPCENNGTCVEARGGSYCMCDTAHEGQFCELVKDVCLRHKCVHGHCMRRDDAHYDCVCDEGYHGRYCGIEIDECTSNPCAHSTVCDDLVGGFRCTCESGWEGELCDISLNDCIDHGCVNGATCVDGMETYSCICPTGFTGSLCNVNIDDCLNKPCQGFAQCIDGINEYTCECPLNRWGTKCQVLKNPCQPNPCMHGGHCINIGIFGIFGPFFCACPDGATGSRCEINIDDCVDNRCVNGAPCVDQVGSYSCFCPTGFIGTFCEDTVSPCIAQPCQNGGSCVEEDGLAICSCLDGYVGSRCELDEDDCIPNPCSNGGSCLDDINEFTCNCIAGYTGQTCDENIDDCHDNECENGATCVDGLDGYSCNCQHGFHGDYCQLKFHGDFDLELNLDYSTIDVILVQPRPVFNFTVSIWLRSNVIHNLVILEYVQDGQYSPLAITATTSQILVNLFGGVFGIYGTVLDEKWHHFALTWKPYCLHVYLDGHDTMFDELSDNFDIRPIFNQYGRFVLGRYDGNGSPSRSDFTRTFSSVNIWQYVLDKLLIQEMANNCSHNARGDILISHDLLASIDESVGVITPSQCEAFNDCASYPCSPESTCIDSYHGYTCLCPPYLIGTTCHEDVIDCTEDSCAAGATCIDGRGSFTCMCPENVSGSSCEISVVDGQWGEWSVWTDCSRSCGGGSMTRVRFCSSPAPSNGGLPCDGEDVQTTTCNLHPCPACKPIPQFENGYLRCNTTEDWEYFCIHQCNEGFVASVPPLESYHCGVSLQYLWNVETPDNPSMRVSSCIRPVSPSEVMVEYSGKYTDLSCTTENRDNVIEEITRGSNLVLNRVCQPGTECYFDAVHVEGCPMDDEIVQGTEVTKAVTFIVNYDPELETESPSETDIAPIIMRLVDEDIDQGGALISISGQIHHLNTTTVNVEGTPLCPPGTYINGQTLLCVPCERGSFWKDQSCFFCPAGSYQPDVGTTFCIECPPSTTSHIGAITLEECTMTDI